MTTPESMTNNITVPSGIPRIQQFARSFIVPSTCVLCLDQILDVGSEYVLLDFTENGGIKYQTILFLHSYQIGYVITITMVDMKSEELIKRSHRLTNDICDWVIIEADFLFPNDNSKKTNR